jgi:phage baseplate assembly protein V
MSAFERAFRPLASRIQMMIGRAVVAAIDDDKMLQTLQIELLDEETQDGVEHFQPYGFSARAQAGAEAIAASVGGLRSHAVVLAVADRRYRMKGLQEGEVALYDDLGQSVLLGRDGIVVTSPLGVKFVTDGDFSVEAQGDVSIKGQGEALIDGASILLGEGAELEAARKTDAVAPDMIIEGSSKVKIA